jgi:phage-related protein
MFAGAIESLIGVIGEAMTTITKAIGSGAVTGFIAGLSAAMAVAAPLLTTLLVMFTGLLKVITPIAGPLGFLIGLFIAFKTAQMAFNLVTVTLAKPIAAITSAWSSASGEMD